MAKTRKERNAEYYAKFKADPELRRIHNERNKASYHANKETRKHHIRKRLLANTMKSFGMTEADYWKMRAMQGDICPACGKPLEGLERSGEIDKNGVRRRPPVDHNHKTGKARAVIHVTCNSSIGLFGDDPVRLRMAADYLEKYDG